MTTKEIANRLVALCRQGKFEDAQKELFAQNAKSIEAEDSPMQPREVKGLNAIIAKGHEFQAAVEKIHSMEISEPLVAEEAFSCTMILDVTMKGRGRNTMSEVCVYDVRDGKITAESFH